MSFENQLKDIQIKSLEGEVKNLVHIIRVLFNTGLQGMDILTAAQTEEVRKEFTDQRLYTTWHKVFKSEYPYLEDECALENLAKIAVGNLIEKMESQNETEGSEGATV